MDKEGFIILVYKRIKGEITSTEASLLAKTINENPEFRDLQEEIEITWRLTNSNVPNLTPTDLQDDWKKLESKMSALSSKTNTRRLPIIYSIAATIVVLIVAGILFTQLKNADPIFVQSQDEIIPLELADGSKIWLNKYSTLSYFANKWQDRSIELNGEAYFQVAPNASKPFVIDANHTKISVVGTAFNVRSRKNSDNTLISVDEGKVIFSSNDTSIALIADEQAVHHRLSGKIEKHVGLLPNASGWQSGVFVYSEMQLSEIIHNLSEIFGVSIDLELEALANCKISLVMRSKEIDVLVEKLAETVNATVQSVSKDHYKLMNGSCQ